MIYNVHLLVGRFPNPATALSLTGQPSACGTATRSVHLRPPPAGRHGGDESAKHRKSPKNSGSSPPAPFPTGLGCHAGPVPGPGRTARGFFWFTTNNMQAGPTSMTKSIPGGAIPRPSWSIPTSIRRFPPCPPTSSCPPPCGWRRKAPYGNAERRGQFWRQQVKAPGECKSDLWQYVGIAKRFKTEEVWPAELPRQDAPEYKGKTLYDVLYANKDTNKFGLDDVKKTNQRARHQGLHERRVPSGGLYLQKGLFEEYAALAAARLTTWPLRRLSRGPGLRWPVVNSRKPAGASAKATIPTCPRAKAYASTVIRTGKAVVSLPYQPAAEMPDSDLTSGCSPAACWSTGIPVL